MRDLPIHQVPPATSLVDIQLDPTGDIGVVGGDLKVCTDLDAIEQGIRWRLLTRRGSWYLEPGCGTELDRMYGAANTRETAEMIEMDIAIALSHDGFLNVGEYSIDIVPLSESVLSVTIDVHAEGIAVAFDLDLGDMKIRNWRRLG